MIDPTRRRGGAAPLARRLCLAGLVACAIPGRCPAQDGYDDIPPPPGYGPRAPEGRQGGGSPLAWFLVTAGGILAVRYWWRRRGRRPVRRPARPAAPAPVPPPALPAVPWPVYADPPPRIPAAPPPIAPPRGEDLVETLCRCTGTLILSDEGDRRYWVRHPSATRGGPIRVIVDHRSVLFQEYLDVDFPLDREPPGLFARLMLRSFSLRFSAWRLNIGGRCDAQVCVVARVPVAGLDADLFDVVCREIVGEIEGFHQELRDKFRWGAGGGMGTAGGAGPPAGRGGPMPRGWDGGPPNVR